MDCTKLLNLLTKMRFVFSSVRSQSLKSSTKIFLCLDSPNIGKKCRLYKFSDNFLTVPTTEHEL